ncbi:MAG: RNA polymerase sigma factor [Clostridia bacterium]
MDEKSFTDAVNQHRDLLYRVSYTVLHNSEDCADALQEALMKAWQRLNTLRDDTRFRSWMTCIVVNCSRDILRKRKVRLTELTEDIPAPQVENARLDDTLQRLDNRLRLPLTLHYMEGLSVQEIADALRLPQGTVKNRMHRGRQKLAELLGEEELV